MNKGIKVDFNNEKEVEISCDNQNEENNINNDINNDNNNINNYAEQNEHNYSYEIMNTNENLESNEINIDHILNNNDIINQGEQFNLQNEVNVFPEQNVTSYNDKILTESTKKTLIQENTLPLKYLPEKVNNVIYDNDINTLPLIDAGKKITYINLPESNNETYDINNI